MGARPGVDAGVSVDAGVGVDCLVGDPVRQGGRGVAGAEGPARTLAAFQRLYLRGLVVPVATAAGLREHYAYLEESLARFPTGPEQVQLALAAGFRQARHRPLAAGLMGLLELVA
jgi:demethylphylloquinol methyltransferase